MDSTQKKLTGAAAIVMSSIVISRLTGFLREMLIPSKLGVDAVGDAYNNAFLVPDLMYNMLVGGAVAAALIPVLSGYIEKKSEENGWKAVGTFINVSFIAMIISCGLGMIFAPQLVNIITAGYGRSTPAAMDLTVRLTRILFPSVAFLMLAGLTNGVLNSYHKFAAAAYGPTIYNIGGILSLLLLSRFGAEAVAYGVMGSSFMYFIIQFLFAYKNFKYYALKLSLRHEGFRRLFTLAIPSLISSSIAQVNLIVSVRFANLFPDGSVTALKMADRTWQMPLGIFAQGIGIAILPTLSASMAVGLTDKYKQILMKGLKMVLLLSIPSAIGFIVLRESIIRTAFKFTDKVDEGVVALTGGILMFFAIALITQSIVAIIIRAFYANNDTKTPLYVGASTIVINFVLCQLFYVKTQMGVSGMALAYSISSLIYAVLLLYMLNKRINGINIGKLVEFLLKVIPAALIMGGILLITDSFLPVNIDSKLSQMTHLMAQVGVGVIVYTAAVLLLKVDEAVFMSEIIFNKIKRVGKILPNKL